MIYISYIYISWHQYHFLIIAKCRMQNAGGVHALARGVTTKIKC